MSKKRSKSSYRRAALAGWRTRRANERKRSAAAKKGWITRRANQRKRNRNITRATRINRISKNNEILLRNVEWLVSIDYNQGKRRRFAADLVIVAKRDATPTELADQAREQLPEGKQFLANWIEGAFVDISMGKSTSRAPRTRVRSFVRHK